MERGDTIKNENEKNETVSKWIHDKDMARMERANKRLWVLVIIIFVALVITNGAWLYYEIQWEVVEETTEQTVTQNVRSSGDSDAVLSGIGDAINGSISEADSEDEDYETISGKEEEKVND